MAALTHTLVLEIEAQAAQARAQLAALGSELDKFGKKKVEATAEIRVEAARARQELATFVAELEALDTAEANPEVRLETSRAIADAKLLDSRLASILRKKEIDIELAQADISSFQGIERQVRGLMQTLHKESTIEIRADVDEALRDVRLLQADLRKLDLSDTTPDVRLNIRRAIIDARLLERELAVLTRDREIDIDVARHTLDRFGILKATATKNIDDLSDAGLRLKAIFSDAGGLGAVRFGRVLKGLTPFLAGVAVLIGTALVPAIALLISSLGAAVGAVGALAAAMVASLGPAVTLLIGLFSRLAAVFGAKQAQDQARAVGARNAAQAGQDAADAARQEAAAAEQLRDAQQQLVTSRRQYAEATRQAREDIRDAAREEAEAIRKVADAERELNQARQALREARSEARDALTEALDRRTEATREFQKATEDAARAVVDANRAMQDAIERTTDAQLALRFAALDLEDAQDRVSDLEREIAKLGETAGAADPLEFLRKLTDVDLRGLDLSSVLGGLGVGAGAIDTERLTDLMRELARAKLEVERATDGLSDSERELNRAQEDQAEFTKNGINAYEPYRNAVEQAAEAQRTLAEATKEYDKLAALGVARAPTVLAAEQGVAEARRGLRDATRDLTDAEREHARLVALGVQGNPQVIAAAEAVRDAQEGIVTANRQAAQSFESMSGRAAQSAAAAAQQFDALSEEEQKFVGFIRRFGGFLRTIIQDGSDAVLLSFRGAMQELGPILAAAEPMFETLGKTWGAAIRSAAHALTGPEWTAAFARAGQSAITLSAIGAQAFGAFAETLRNIGVAALPSLERVSRGVRDFFRDTSRGTKDTEGLSKTIAKLTDHLVLWLELTWAITQAFAAFVDATLEPSAEFVRWIRDGVKSLRDWMRSAEGQERIQAFFKDTVPFVKEFVKFIGQLLIIGLQLFQFFAPFLADMFRAINLLLTPVRILLELLNKIPAPIRSLLAGLLLLGPVGIGVKATFQGLALVFTRGITVTKFLTEIFLNLGKSLTAGLGHAIELIATVGGLISSLINLGKAAAGAGAAILGGFIEGLGNLGEAFIGWIVDAWDALLGWLGIHSISDKGIEVGKAIAAGIVGGIKALPGLFVDAAAWLFNTWRNAVHAYVETYLGIGRWIIGKVLEGLKAVGSALADAATWLAQRWWAAVRAEAELILSIGRWVIGKVVDGARAAVDLVQGIAGFIIRNIRHGFGQGIDRILEVGKAIVEGIWNGIKDAKDWFIDKIKGGPVSWVKEAFGAKSPATTMVPLGEDVVAGLVVGIEQAGPAFTKAIAGLAEAVELPALTADVGKIDASGIVTSITDSVAQAKGVSEEAGGTITEAIAAGVEATPEPLDAAGAWLVQQAAASVGAQTPAWLALGAWITQTIFTGARALVASLTAYGLWLYQQAQGSVHAQAPSFFSLGGWITSTVLNGARAAMAVIAPFASTLRDAAFVDIQRIEWTHLGEYAASEILRGMITRVNEPEEVVSFGRALVRSVEDFFGIKSPSRVFMSIGQMLTEGLIVGLARKNPISIIESQFGNMARFARGLVLNAPDWLPGKGISSMGNMAHLGLELWDRDLMQLGSIPDRLFDEIFGFPKNVVDRYFGRESQSDIAAIIVAVGKHLRAQTLELLAAIATALVESNMKNLARGDRDSLGVFQQRPSMGWGTPKQILNPFYSARKFFETAIGLRPHTSAGTLAQEVQRSAFPGRYFERLAEAMDWLRKLGVRGIKGTEFDTDYKKIGKLMGGTGTDLFGAVWEIARQFGLSITSGLRLGDTGSLHSVNRARDYGDGARAMLEFAWEIYRRFRRMLEELFHDPLGFSITTRGVRGGAHAGGPHYDHVHVAFAQGGIVRGAVAALLGERVGVHEAVLPLTDQVLGRLGASIASHMTVRLPNVRGPIYGQPESTRVDSPRTYNIHVPPAAPAMPQPDAEITAALIGQKLAARGVG